MDVKLQSHKFLTVTKGQIYSGDPIVTEKEVEEIAHRVKTRNHPQRQGLIYAIKQNGGCTKAFPDVNQLPHWVTVNYQHDWKFELMLHPTAGPKPQRKTTTTTLSATLHE